MNRRVFLGSTVALTGVLAGCGGGDAIIKLRTSSNIGKTRERELTEGDRLELAVRSENRSTTATATVTRLSTGEVVAERVDTANQWSGEEFTVPASETYEIHLESSYGNTSRMRLRKVEQASEQ